MLSSLSAWASRWTTKCRRASTNKLTPAPSSDKLEFRLVLVQEKRLSVSDDETPRDAAMYGTPVLDWTNVMLQPHLLPLRRTSVATTGGELALPSDALALIMTFVPIQRYQQLSLVCTEWAAVARQSAHLALREARLFLNQGLHLMAESNYPEESVKLFSRAIELYPKLADASFWKAKSLFILSDEAQAVHCLQRALAQHPAPVDRMKLQACMFYAQSNDLAASQLLESAVQKAPYDAAIHFELGFCYHGMQQFGRAIDSYTRAQELKYHRSFVLLANRANCLFRTGRIPEAFVDLEASLKVSAHYELALRTRAFVSMHIGDTQQAYRDYTTIIDTSKIPKILSDAYCNRAFCNGEMDEDDIERARKADPTNPEPIRYKASLLANRNHVAEAISHVTSWIEANPDHKDCPIQRAFRGELHVAARDVALAIQDYKDAIASLSSGPSNADHAGTSTADTLLNYRERLRDLLQEQRRIAGQ